MIDDLREKRKHKVLKAQAQDQEAWNQKFRKENKSE